MSKSVLVTVLWTLAAASWAADFPQPITRELADDVLCVLNVDLEPGLAEYVVVGSADGAVALYSFNAGSDQFTFLGRKYFGGRVMDLASWEGRPVSDQGLVVATADPDRLHFLNLEPSAPVMTPVTTLDLPEDPGTLAFAGDPGVGTRELAVSLPGVDRILLFVPDGGGWRLDQELPAGDRPEDLLGIDLDGDQVRELVSANRGALSGSIGVWRRNADGRYDMTTHPLAQGTPYRLAAFDLDGDGRDELFSTMEGLPRVAMLRQAGGLLEVVETVDLPLPGEALFMDRLFDGTPGLFVTNAERGMVAFMRREGSRWQTRDTYYPGCLPVGLTTADLDGDDARDLVCVGGDTRVFSALLANDGPGYWGVPALALGGTPGPSISGDFTGDGREDLAVIVGYQTVVSLIQGLPGGGYQREAEEWDLGFFVLGAVALSADGEPGEEIALLDAQARQVVVLGYEQASGWIEISRTDLGASPLWISAADVDGDGREDVLAVVRDQAEVRILFGDGSGGFDQVLTMGFGGFADRLAALDLDGDGLLDLAASDGNSRVWTQRNLDGRSFGDLAWLNAGTGALNLAQGDLDGDGDDDLVALNTVEESLSFFENDGNGELIRRIGSHAMSSKPVGVAVEDLDRDGVNEVVVNLPDEHRLAAVFRTGSWDYSDLVELGRAPGMASFRVTDINLDDVPDILAVDGVLQAGLTLLNLDVLPVANEPVDLLAACSEEGVTITVRPESGRAWRLEYGDGAGWNPLAENGQSGTAALDYDRGAWRLTLDPGAVDARDGRLLLRLVTGAAGNEAVTVREFDLECPDQGTATASLLAWRREPWPNPFNPRVQARFTLARESDVRVGIYDLSGRLVSEIAGGRYRAGEHAVTWDGRSHRGTAPAGVYFLRVDSPGQVLSRKIMLLK